jgi:type II secretory pathway pseudopilin PulG
MRSNGFSLVELTIAIALTLLLAASLFALTRASRAASAAQSEAADVQQRMRVAVDTIAHDLANGGAGPALVDHSGPLNTWIPAVLPFRRGMIASDPPGAVRQDVITIVEVPTTAAQTRLTADAAPGSQALQVARVPGCAAGVNLCSFATGMLVLVFEDSGAFQIFTAAAVLDGALLVTTTTPADTFFHTGAVVVEAEVHALALKPDAATRSTQLVHYDGTANADAPVLDHVVSLAFDYGIPPSDFVDGPWRPDAASVNRWDVDLLRIRTVAVTIRIEAALAALRGPAGVLFANAGTATDPHAWVPDRTLRFQVSPRNLNLR